MSSDQTDKLKTRILDALENNHPVKIVGGNSKAFLGRKPVSDNEINTRVHNGIISYEPGELTLTARSGTPLKEIEAVLTDHNQMLAFEPPHFGDGATLGGTIACNLSGPRRPYSGAARDFVLGTRIINGKGEVLRFGGEVIKNVAGYDVSRLMTGAMGTLGLILDVSLKVLPRPETEITRSFEFKPGEAIAQMNAWAGQSLPVSATCFYDGRLYLRLSGSKSATLSAAQRMGGEPVLNPDRFWIDLREHSLPFFESDRLLWRFSLPGITEPLSASDAPMLIEWGGSQRWCFSSLPPAEIHQMLESVGGHATQFRHHNGISEVYHPLKPVIKLLHRNLKNAFDPNNILNPGQQYLEI